MEILNTTDFVENTMCQECTCQGGLPSNCKQLYHCHLTYKKCEKYIMTSDHCCPVCGETCIKKLYISLVFLYVGCRIRIKISIVSTTTLLH